MQNTENRNIGALQLYTFSIFRRKIIMIIMYIEKLTITKFRSIEHLVIEFNKGVNIIVGENNVGKTSIIDAIRICLSIGKQWRDIGIKNPEDFYIYNSLISDVLEPIEFLLEFKIEEAEDRQLFHSLLWQNPIYNLMKNEYNEIISNLEKEMGNVEDDRGNIEYLTNSGLENLLKLGEAFDNANLADSREIIGLIFPENFTFRENKIQTARINEMVNCIYLVNNRLQAKKNGTKDDIFLLSRVVTPTGQISTKFMEDLKRLAYWK